MVGVLEVTDKALIIIRGTVGYQWEVPEVDNVVAEVDLHRRRLRACLMQPPLLRPRVRTRL